MIFGTSLCGRLRRGIALDWRQTDKRAFALVLLLCITCSACRSLATESDAGDIRRTDVGRLAVDAGPHLADSIEVDHIAADCGAAAVGNFASAATPRATVNPMCLQFGFCPIMGRCTYVPGEEQCFAASDADCLLSQLCKDWGDCDFYPGVGVSQLVGLTVGYCTALAKSDCQGHRACGLNGRCAAVGELCKPTTQRHCADALYCKLKGLCTLQDGACVVTSEEHCAKSVECRSEGRCHLWTHPQSSVGNRCVPLTSEDCQKSAECVLNASCVLDTHLPGGIGEQYCGRDEHIDCKGLPICAMHGRCMSSSGGCLVGSDADCQQSAACLREGRCWKGPLFDCDYYWPTWKVPQP